MTVGALELVIVLLASAVVAVALFRVFELPPVLGYLIVGFAVGPSAMGWIPESDETERLAEFGVVFLMFSIGLEFSLPKLFRMRRVVFGLGLVQVSLSLIIVTLASMAAGFGWKPGFAVGGAIAMSSTAIVVRLMMERRQMDTPHGREILGVLLFQDLAVVPMLIIIPAIAGDPAELTQRLGVAFAKAAAILFVMLFIGQQVMRRWFHMVAGRRTRELFVLNVLLVTLGLAWLTEMAGLSLALGAFLAGTLIAETEYRHQVEEDIKPFRDILLGLFFVTVGMKLAPGLVWDHITLVLGLAAGLVATKFALIAALSRLFGAPSGTALRSGLALAQAGEFGLVLMVLAQESLLLASSTSQVVIAAMLISMFLAPFLIQSSDRLALRWSKNEWMLQSLALHKVAVQSIGVEKHVLICGYGRTGQRLAHLLEQEGIRYIALDPDPERIREAAAAGESVVFGDAGHSGTLQAAGIARAAVLVVTFNDTAAALKILSHARSLNPALAIIVRTTDDAEMERLLAAGATEVVPETFESSLMLASHALVLLGVPLKRVIRRIRDVRDDRYSLLRGFFHGGTDEPDSVAEASGARLHSVSLSAGAYAIGRTARTLSLDEIGVGVTAVRRQDERIMKPQPDMEFRQGDVVVLIGSRDALQRAERQILKGALE